MSFVPIVSAIAKQNSGSYIAFNFYLIWNNSSLFVFHDIGFFFLGVQAINFVEPPSYGLVCYTVMDKQRPYLEVF